MQCYHHSSSSYSGRHICDNLYYCVPMSGLTSRSSGVKPAGGVDAIVYDVTDERVGTMLAMKENEAYSINERVGGTLEMKENEAYSIGERVGGLKLK